jgi:hypothetical protein
MAEQLMSLIQLGQRPNIDIWVVPARIGWHPGSAGPFVCYEFPDADPVVHFEHYSSGAFVPNVDNVREYEDAVSDLKDLAVGPHRSAAFIAGIVEEWRAEHDRYSLA